MWLVWSIIDCELFPSTLKRSRSIRIPEPDYRFLSPLSLPPRLKTQKPTSTPPAAVSDSDSDSDTDGHALGLGAFVQIGIDYDVKWEFVAGEPLLIGIGATENGPIAADPLHRCDL